MTEAKIMRWLIGEGEDCVEGQPLFEMETDKTTATVDSPATGKLLKIYASEGDTVPVAEIVAAIGGPGENISARPPTGGEGNAPDASPLLRCENADKLIPATPLQEKTSRKLISPRAKKLAEELGIHFSSLRGTGPDGMVVERDVRRMAEAELRNTKLRDTELRDTERRDTKRHDTTIPVTGMRKAIAGKMTRSLHASAQTHHRVYADMTQAALLRKAHSDDGANLSFNDIVIYAVSRALKKHPIMNAVFDDDIILLKGSVNIGIAVALEEGLVVPVLRDADTMSLAEIAKAARSLVEKAKAGKLDAGSYCGGTFTVSNLGMLGIDEFVAIVNPPESGILAVGKINETPVAVNGEIRVAPIMSLTLTYDHRIVDGAPAAGFLTCVKEYIEKPYMPLFC